MKYVYKVVAQIETLREISFLEFIIDSIVSPNNIKAMVIGYIYLEVNKDRKEDKFVKVNSLDINLLMKIEG